VNKEKSQTVFANRMLRKPFICNREEVTRDFTHTMKNCTIYSRHQIGLDLIREDEIGRACGTRGKEKNACRILVEKSE